MESEVCRDARHQTQQMIRLFVVTGIFCVTMNRGTSSNVKSGERCQGLGIRLSLNRHCGFGMASAGLTTLRERDSGGRRQRRADRTFNQGTMSHLTRVTELEPASLREGDSPRTEQHNVGSDFPETRTWMLAFESDQRRSKCSTIIA